jgi:hypothetical protein
MTQSIESILQDYGVQVAGSSDRHYRQGWVHVDCPHCSPESGNYYLGISKTTLGCSCWNCGKKRLFATIALLTGQKPNSVKTLLAGIHREELPERKAGTLILPTGRGNLLPGHETYLCSRGFDPAHVVRLWHVEGIGQHSRLGWRLFIPIHHAGKIVSWTTRSIKRDEKLRYLSASASEEAIPHKEILYGGDYCRHTVIVHEGPLDVWATGPGAVAVCGTSYTDRQLLAIARYPRRVVCFDAEPVAQERAKGLCSDLAVFPGETLNVVLETGNDPASCDFSEIEALRQYCV